MKITPGELAAVGGELRSLAGFADDAGRVAAELAAGQFGHAGRAAGTAVEALGTLDGIGLGVTAARQADTGQTLWQLTREGADKVMHSPRFGTFFRSTSDGTWWARDQAGHGGSAFKVFDGGSKGLTWRADADSFGNYLIGKHKGDTGRFIPWSQLKGKR